MRTTSQPNLIAEQRSLLKKIYGQGDNLWKVLVFDNFNREVNSAMFKMKDLRENNITLYFHIKDNREQLHGVTAIYLVQPNQDNLNRIIEDFEEDLYSSVIIHFSSEPQTHIISTFAKNISKNRPAALTKINKIQYSCLGFHTVSKNMAIMQGNNEIINLISILKNKPIFISGTKQEQQISFIRERLSEGSVFGKQQQMGNVKQPHNIIFFFNRESDYFPVLHHSITYAGLIQSIYKLAPNGQKIVRGKGKDSIQIDLNDDIWTERRNSPISELSLSEQLNVIKVKLMGQKQKLNQINQLSQRQKKIQLHMTIASQLIQEATARKLNQYNQIEMQIYRKRVLTSQLKKDVMVLIQTTENQTDKIRLILIVLLYCQHISNGEVQEFQSRVPGLKKSRLYGEIREKIMKEGRVEQGGMVGGAGKMLKKFSIGLLSNFKNGDKFLIAKLLQKVTALKQNQLREMGLSISSLSPLPLGLKIGSIIVYCLGGGCLSQQANLQKADNRIIYTCDQMLNSSDLIS